MDFAPIATFIKEVGFPAGIAVFVLWRLDRSLREMVAELRAFRESTVVSATDLEQHVTQQGDRIIREVDHNVRGAIGHLSVRREP